MAYKALASATVETVDTDQLNAKWRQLPAPLAYHKWVREYRTMARHTQGRIDDIIIRERRPYEPVEIQNYRVRNFRAITKSAMNRALNTLQRIFSKAGVDVQVPDAAKDFFAEKQFEDCDFMGYVNKWVTRRMIEDPNGLLAWWADYPGVDNKRVVPRPIMVLSENVVHISEELFAFASEEKSEVIEYVDGKPKKVMKGEVYFFATKYGYYRREQYGTASKKNFRIVPGYAHQLGYLPYVELGGEETMECLSTEHMRTTTIGGAVGNTTTTYLTPEQAAATPMITTMQIGTVNASNRYVRWFTSYFSPCTEFADEALHQFSDHQGIMVTAAFPLREMEKIKCPNPDCKGTGRVMVYNVKKQAETKQTCQVCNGKGEIMPTTPYGTIWRESKRSGFAENPKADPVPALRYISPDVAIVEYNGKHWRELLLDMEKALNLLFVEEAQSGVAKTIDREDKVSTLDRIGQQVFGVIVANSIEMAMALMKITGDVEITMPATFVVRSEEELRKEIEELGGGGLMLLYQSRAMLELVRKRFPSDRKMHKCVEVLSTYDLAFGYTAEEKAALVAQGVLNEDVVAKSAIAPNMVNRIAEEKGDAFLNMQIDAIALELDKRLDAELSERPVMPPLPSPAPANIPKPPGNAATGAGTAANNTGN